MKKLLTVVLTVILVSAVFVSCSLTGTDGKKDEIVVQTVTSTTSSPTTAHTYTTTGVFTGRWTAQKDISPFINDRLTNGDDTAMQYLGIDEFVIDVEYEFRQDGTFTATLDMNDLEIRCELLEDQLKSGYKAYIAAVNENSGDIAEDYDELAHNAAEQLALPENLSKYNLAGEYTAQGGNLSLTYADSDTPDDYWSYGFDGDDILLLYDERGDELGVLPLELARKV